MFLMCDLCTGKTWQLKIQELQVKLKEKGCYGVVVAALDEVACKSVFFFSALINQSKRSKDRMNKRVFLKS